tara:strand:- start:640 stop:807 length:168 start_codon:yes stop_codon:yes gene_type:complete
LILGSTNYAEFSTLWIGKNHSHKPEVAWITCRSEHSRAKGNEAVNFVSYLVDKNI